MKLRDYVVEFAPKIFSYELARRGVITYNSNVVRQEFHDARTRSTIVSPATA